MRSVCPRVWKEKEGTGKREIGLREKNEQESCSIVIDDSSEKKRQYLGIAGKICMYNKQQNHLQVESEQDVTSPVGSTL